MKDILKENLEKCDTLDPSVIDIAKQSVTDAFKKNMTFRISEARRTYERQCLLLSQGREKSDIMRNSFPGGFKLNAKQMKDMMKIYDSGKNLKGPIVTWTLNSDHILGLAIDIYPINTTYAELSLHFNRWGIRSLVKGDQPHFDLTGAFSLNKEIPMNNTMRIRRLERILRLPMEEEKYKQLSKILSRLKKAKGVQ